MINPFCFIVGFFMSYKLVETYHPKYRLIKILYITKYMIKLVAPG